MRDAKALGLTVPFSLLARAVRLWRKADQMNWPHTTFRSTGDGRALCINCRDMHLRQNHENAFDPRNRIGEIADYENLFAGVKLASLRI
jgi:hypothetical protein